MEVRLLDRLRWAWTRVQRRWVYPLWGLFHFPKETRPRYRPFLSVLNCSAGLSDYSTLLLVAAIIVSHHTCSNVVRLDAISLLNAERLWSILFQYV